MTFKGLLLFSFLLFLTFDLSEQIFFRRRYRGPSGPPRPAVSDKYVPPKASDAWNYYPSSRRVHGGGSEVGEYVGKDRSYAHGFGPRGARYAKGLAR
ncbi:hypothetical protein HDE_03751 [Halotydeus destructor]|nr:hypothetical protein HDE_03751 [Halotydeus destructor]